MFLEATIQESEGTVAAARTGVSLSFVSHLAGVLFLRKLRHLLIEEWLLKCRDRGVDRIEGANNSVLGNLVQYQLHRNPGPFDDRLTDHDLGILDDAILEVGLTRTFGVHK